MSTRDDEFWAGFLGVDPSTFDECTTTVGPHAGLGDYVGFWCFRRKQRTVISAAPGWVPRLEELAAAAGDETMDPGFWQRALGADFERAIGPAFQGCLAAENFRPAHSPIVRAVTAEDARALDELREACGDEWNMPEAAEHYRYACFESGFATALAGYRSWSEEAGDPAVIAHPEARGGGRGAAVTSAVVEDALEAGKLLLYQTLEANTPAVRIAFSLGYQRYANHLAVRLTNESPTN